MEDKNAMRAALLKQLLKAVGTNRIKGFSITEIDPHDAKEAKEAELGPKVEEEDEVDADEYGILGDKPFSKLKKV